MPDVTLDGSLAPLAIVGMSCRLPGGANSPDELWELLKEAGEAWMPVPKDRFNEAAFYHPSSDDPNGTNNHRGGHFIDRDLSDFDHAFFRLSPQQAAAMDPHQRVLLEMSYEAIENAGMTLESCSGSNTSVYVASFTADFERNLYKDPLNMPLYYITGVETAILSNRISHAFNLHGPSMTIDTGCSGGMVALHQACVSLRSGESDAAIVAAANLTLGPDHHIGMSNLHLISGSGHSYPFDVRGDGYGRGEGCVALMVKRLDDAIRDGNPIKAVVRNTAVNQDGYTPASITYPNGLAQEKLIRTAYERAGLRTDDVVYVESHGTGTAAGDFEELTAIANVFTGPESDRQEKPLYVGSIKGNIGHTENTSGLASLIKASLILDRLEIPPTAGLSTPKPGLPLEKIRLPTTLVAWPTPKDEGHATPRVSINSFGFGGCNAHAILERAPSQCSPRVTPAASAPTAPHLFTFSANSQSSLTKMMASHRAWIQDHGDQLANFSYTLCHRRSRLPWRFSCVASDQESLDQTLDDAVTTSQASQARADHHLVFVFTGQGAQWLGMGRELLLISKLFRESILGSRDTLFELGATWNLEEELLRPPTESSLLNTAALAQPVTTAVQIALVELLRELGLLGGSCAVVGHSSGEIAAAYAAGYLTARQALGVAYHRGFMTRVVKTHGLPPGAMLSVGLGENEVLPFMKNLSKGMATIACINSPNSVTISGDADAVEEISARLATYEGEEGTIFQRRLLVDTAYHSHHMQAVADVYRQQLKGLGLEEGTSLAGNHVIFFSSVSGLPKTEGFGAEYWITNLVSPVRFYDAIKAIANTEYYSQRKVSFIEIGPHSAMAGPVRQCLAESTRITSSTAGYYSVLQRKIDAVVSTLALVGRLIDIGVDMDLGEVASLSSTPKNVTALANLPSYPWDHSQKHMFESRISKEYRMRRDPYHDLLGVRALDATPLEPRWRHMIGLNTLPWLEDHVIDSQIVFPGSGYLCMAIEAIGQFSRERHPERPLETISLRNVSFLRALIVPELPDRTEMQLSLSPEPSEELGFTFRVSSLRDGEWREHCTGSVQGRLTQVNAWGEGKHHPLGKAPEIFDRSRKSYGHHELYRLLSESGNTYGPAFSGIQHLSLNNDTALATVKVPDIAAFMPAQYQQPHLIHPSTLDTILHSVLPLASRCFGKGSIMPVHINELLISATAPILKEPSSQFDVCSQLRSAHFRTAYTDLSVSVSGREILTASGIEMRSLAVQSGPVDESRDIAGICYEIAWRPDIDMALSNDIPSSTTLGDIVRNIMFKKGTLAVLNLVTDHHDLTSAFFDALPTRDIKRLEYELASPTTDSFHEAHKRLRGYPIRYRTLDVEADILGQGFEAGCYDVVLIQGTSLFESASVLVRPDGVVILERKEANEDESWHTNLREASLEAQLSFYDAQRESHFAIVRPARTEEWPEYVRILTHSDGHASPAYVVALQESLISRAVEVSVSTLQSLSTSFDASALKAEAGRLCFVVVDDEPESPILADPNCFEVVTTLLKQPSVRILWISPDEPAPMQQITGVARTAHAENDGLRLTLVHVASRLLLADGFVHGTMRELLKRAFASQGPHIEREYCIDEAGVVLVPRVHSSASLNSVVHAENTSHDQCYDGVKLVQFAEDARTFALCGQANKKMLPGGEPTFHQQPETTGILADQDLEVQVDAFEVSSYDSNMSHWAYAGVVTRIGTAVHDWSPGERVLLIGSIQGANRIRVPSKCAARLPSIMTPAEGAGRLLEAMTASYALHSQARLSPQNSLLVHDALSPVGRAAVAFAHSMGARVHATSGSVSESCLITAELDIPESQVIRIGQRNTTKCPSMVSKFDVILQASPSEVPEHIISRLKPFGCFVVAAIDASKPGRQMETMAVPKTLRNQAIFFCDLAQLLQERPKLTSELLQQAIGILEHSLSSGSDICVRPVTHVAQALHLVETGVYDRVVLEADAKSTIKAVLQPRVDDQWSRDFTYIITGGLGDLGQRLLSLMARRGAKHLVTLSRRPVDEKERLRIQMHLREASPGCNLYCISCDLTAEASLQRAADALTRIGVPPVRGIIQSAAILQDRTLDSMTYDDFVLASRVKIDGTLSLERTFASPHLEFFLMLSSVVNIVGASGQANYNAGNSVLDGLAQARHWQGSKCQYMSLNIGWIEDAVHTVNDDARLNAIRRAGLKAITHDELSRYFEYALGAGTATSSARPAQAIIGFDSGSLSNATAPNGTVQSALFCHIRNPTASTRPDNTAQNAANNPVFFADAMADNDTESATQIVLTAVKSHLARLISVPVDRIDSSTAVLSLGVDSLVSIELRNWIVRQFESPMQSSEILMDQSIQALAEKVVSRSRVGSRSFNRKDRESSPSASDSLSSSLLLVSSVLQSASSVTTAETGSTNGGIELPSLPHPSLEATLALFEESRLAVDPPEVQRNTADAVRQFLEGPGPDLQHQLESLSEENDLVARAYERHIYLDRREPLQDYSQFFVGHTPNAPCHSQTTRATILTVSAMQFARRLARCEVVSDELLRAPVNTEASSWMFYATRRPGITTDSMTSFPPNETVAVLRRGHVFQLDLNDLSDASLLDVVYAAYEAIIKESEEPQPCVGTLTADSRRSWANMRGELEKQPGNGPILTVLDTCAFVVCLDDDAPSDAGQRHTQFLLGGREQPFSNRWHDKPVQLAVTANGFSAGIFEHTKLDALDVRSFTSHLTRSLFSSSRPGSTAAACPFRKLPWKVNGETIRRIDTINFSGAAYGPLDHRYAHAENLGLEFLARQRVSPHATIHLTVLLAMYLVDGSVRPAWEIASLARFSRGRIDWVQTVTPPVRAFVEAAAAALVHHDLSDVDAKGKLRLLFDAAAGQVTQLLSTAANGLGYVGQLYALLAMLQGEEEPSNNTSQRRPPLPKLFCSQAWNATRRGGTGQDLKIGFMPSEDEDDDKWDEGGFVMEGERGVYVHCHVHRNQTKFAVSARPEYAYQVCEALGNASEVIRALLRKV